MAYLPYQLNNNVILNLSDNNEYNSKENQITNNKILLNIDPKFKVSVINFLINFWKNLNDIIKKSLKKILLDGQLSQTIFKDNKESIDINYNEKSTRTSIINYLNKGKSYLWCGGELNLYLQFDYLYDCLKLLRLYLINY